MNKGSEWHIWDLHVHTPSSIVNHFEAGSVGDVWENYIQDLEHLPKEVKVLGINDYLFVDGYKKVIDYKRQGRLQNIDLILPVVEFRLSQFGGHDQFKRVNFHVIFSNQVNVSIIQSQFLNALSAKYKLSPEYESLIWGGTITEDNLRTLGKQIIESVPVGERSKYKSDLIEGFNNLNFSYNDIINVLEGAPQFFDGKYLTAIGKTEWDAIKWNDSSIAEKKNIINRVDFVFTAAESVDAYNSALEKLTNGSVNNRLLDCSDAHNNASSSNKDRIGNCHCWIKAETTFEGLKQVLYEPEERKQVSLMKPQRKNSYQIIDHIELNESGFWRDIIPLNPNLNTIIGGRVTGKSTLLKAMAAKQEGIKLKESDSFVTNHLGSVKVIWEDGAEHPENQIDFFRQSYMHDLAENESEFNKVLKSIITDKDEKQILSNYETNNNQLKSQLIQDILELFQNRSSIQSIEAKIKSKGNKAGIVKGVEELKAKLQELSKGASLTPEELAQYQKLSEEKSKNESLITKATKDIALLSNGNSQSLINNSYLRTLGLDSLEFGDNLMQVQNSFNTLSVKVKEAWTSFLQKRITLTKESVAKLQAEIASIITSDIYKKGQKFYADNKEIGDLKTKIQEEETKLKEIESFEKELAKNQKEEKRLFDSIVDSHMQYLVNVQDVVDNLHFSTGGLEIKCKSKLRKEELSGFLDNAFNVRSYERADYLNKLKSGYEIKTESTIRDFLKKALADEITLKNYNEIQQVTTRMLSENWFLIDFVLQYQNDTFQQMSSGKQAFVILKLLLDFSDKKNPIFIDQPEDSLDNRAIYNELVSYIVKKKKERQIILVTHNPNVVVSSDSENVIVANQEGNDSKNDNACRFQYINGALENTAIKDNDCEFVLKSQGIREHVCEILEGGRDAFIKREQKYGFKR